MVSPLDRKMLRDLRRIKGQALAIALVIAVGVLMLVMMNGLVNTLDQTRRTYYERFRLAEVFAPVTRAPEQTAQALRALPGVNLVETRITGQALLDVAQDELPVRAQVLSLPETGTARLNHIHLASGRIPATGHAEEIILLQGFAQARALKLGDRFQATMNGARHGFVIVGLAQSPEFLYTTAPGEIVPDDARFAVIWMQRRALAAAYDMQGAYNEALFALSHDTRPEPVIEGADRVLAAYGAIGAYGVKDLTSNRFVNEEINGLRQSATAVPPVFLAVAAFLLYIVISRMVQSEREQIGLLKAFGYSSAEVSLHYLKLVLVIALFGAGLGALGGVLAGQAMAVLYQSYFKFPFLVFQVDPRSFVTGFMVSILAASAGSLFVLRGVFALTPAVAMRPPAPPDYSRSLDLAALMKRWLDQPSRMVLRRISRYPGRMLGATIGIATGMALSVAMLTMLAGFNHTVDLSFGVIDRSDLTVSFVRPTGDAALHDLAHLPGVGHVEPMRVVPAVLKHGRHSYRGAVEGRISDPILNRVLGPGGQPISISGRGIVLAKPLADILHIQPGDTLTIDAREGRRPTLQVPVTAIAETLLGAPAFMEITALNRTLQEPGRISAAFMTLDTNAEAALIAQAKTIPTLAGVSLKREARDALVEIMNKGPGSVRYVMLFLAALITFGIIYNAARIGYAERARDLASLRVMGFTRAEASFVLLGELAIVTLAAIPLGIALGYGLTYLIVQGFSTDIYQIPVVFSPHSYGMAILAVLGAALISGWLVKRELDQIDMVASLKSRD